MTASGRTVNPSTADSDNELARKAAAGDEDAFEGLFDRHARMVLNVAYRILGNRQDAEEALQEVFMAAHRDLGRFRREASFATWLYRIALGRALNFRKSRGRYQAKLDRLAREVPESPALGVGSETGEKVQRALGALPEEYRALAVLRYLEGLSLEELSGVLGCPMGTVKSKLFRLHQSLRNALIKEDRNS